MVNRETSLLLTPQNTLYAIKRLPVVVLEDEEVQRDIETRPLTLLKLITGDAWVEAQGQKMAVPQVSAGSS